MLEITGSDGASSCPEVSFFSVSVILVSFCYVSSPIYKNRTSIQTEFSLGKAQKQNHSNQVLKVRHSIFREVILYLLWDKHFIIIIKYIIILDQNLDWKDHIAFVTNKIHSRAHAIRSLSEIVRLNCWLTYIGGTIMSTLFPIWDMA